MWADRLRDWRVANGRLECVEGRPAKPMRTVHLLTHRPGKREGGLTMNALTALVDAKIGASKQPAAGFLLGVGGIGGIGGIFAGVDGDSHALLARDDGHLRRRGSSRISAPTRELRLELGK